MGLNPSKPNEPVRSKNVHPQMHPPRSVAVLTAGGTVLRLVVPLSTAMANIRPAPHLKNTRPTSA